MSDLIRGSQVTFHKLRMLMQVSRVLFKIGLFLVVILMSYCYWRDISYQEWKAGANWIKAKIDNKNHHKLSDPITHRNEKIFIDKFKIASYRALLTTSMMFIFVLGGTIVYFWFKGKSIKKSTNIRGIFSITSRDLRKRIKSHNRQFKNYKPFNIAEFPYPIAGRPKSWSSGEQSHTLLVGSTGAGKTTIIKHLIYQLHKQNQKAIIIDIKGDFIECFYREKRGDIILNPLDARGRNWSIFNETNPLKGFSTIAKSLLPKESKSDPIWIDAARGVLAELASLYVSENLSMAEFADKILKSELSTLAKLLKKTSASKVINEDIEKAALSVLMVLSTYLRAFKLYRNADNCFSITDWINDKEQNNFLFISSVADMKEDINPLVTTQVDIAINALRSLKESSNIPKIWFILDEISYFDQAIPSLRDGLATARSFGGCFVLGTQDMSSMSKIYSKEVAESMANNCKTKVFMNVVGRETAEWCSHCLGDGEVEEWHEGLSYGAHEMRDGIQVNRNKMLRRVALPSEFMMLKSGEGIISFAGFLPSKFNFEDCYFTKIANGYEENTELYGLFSKELEEGEKRRKEIEAMLAAKNENTERLLLNEPSSTKQSFKQKMKTNNKESIKSYKPLEEHDLTNDW